MSKRTFYGKIENHAMNSSLRALDSYVEWGAEDGFYKISIENTGDTISGKQMRYFWGVIMKRIVAHLRLTDKDDINELYEYLKRDVGGLHYWRLSTFSGVGVMYTKSIKDIAVKETEEFFEKVRAYATDPLEGWGIQIPLPNEYNLQEISDD